MGRSGPFIDAFLRPTEKIPGSELEEISLDEDVVVLQHMLDVLWAVDDDGRRQRRHRDLKRAKANLSLALAEPVEQLVPWLQEPESITSEGQGTWGSSVTKLVKAVYQFWVTGLCFTVASLRCV